jgi:hypothetical protein
MQSWVRRTAHLVRLAAQLLGAAHQIMDALVLHEVAGDDELQAVPRSHDVFCLQAAVGRHDRIELTEAHVQVLDGAAAVQARRRRHGDHQHSRIRDTARKPRLLLHR